MTIRTQVLALSTVITVAFASVAFAQTPAPTPDHPRVNEINQRLENQDKRIDAAQASGAITADQAKRDEARDARIQNRANALEAKQGGHLTKGEQHHLNKELNKTNHIERRQVRRDKKAAAQ